MPDPLPATLMLADRNETPPRILHAARTKDGLTTCGMAGWPGRMAEFIVHQNEDADPPHRMNVVIQASMDRSPVPNKARFASLRTSLAITEACQKAGLTLDQIYRGDPASMRR